MVDRHAEPTVNNAKESQQATNLWNDGILDKTESQQMLAPGHLLKKSKPHKQDLQQFRATIAADKNKLKSLIARRSKKIKTKQKYHDNELASKILEALRTPNRRSQGEIATFAGTRITNNAIHTAVTNVLSASEGLVGEYKRLDGIISKLRDQQTHPITEKWRQDVEETEKQLRLGARVALRNVRKVLGAEMGSGGATALADEDGDVHMD